MFLKWYKELDEKERREKTQDTQSRLAEMSNNTRRNKEWIRYQKVMFGSLKAETVECIKKTLKDVDVH